MTDEFESRLKAVDQATLTPFVRAILENESVEVTSWSYQPIEGGFGDSYGVYRFQGEARIGDETLVWSLILKVIGSESGSHVPSASNYWKREALVYQSGLLNTLPGDLVAPRCVGVVEYPGQEFWLWLEDVVESGNKVWSLERYGLAARHLGQFNGAYLAGKPIPELSWLSTGQLRQQLTTAEPGITELSQLSQHPMFKDLLPGDSLTRSLTLWSDRKRLLALLDRLPQSLCHHDAFRGNLMARNGPNGQEQTVAIDWAEMSIARIGEELVSLLLGFRFVAIDIDKIAELDVLIFSGYLDGLREAGWRGDARLARFGYAATAALESIADRAIKWPRLARRVAALPAGAEFPRLLDAGGPAQHVALYRHLLDLGDEARALINDLEKEVAA